MNEYTAPEVWAPIVGFEGYYEVSSLGRVRRIAPIPARFYGRVLSTWQGNYGYPAVDLCVDGETTRIQVHREVARAFLGACPEFETVEHIDGNRTNNRLSNLMYLPRSENSRRAAIRRWTRVRAARRAA